MQNEINDLRETIEFYKERLEEDGLTLNMDEIKRIKEEFEKQVDNREKAVDAISKEYQ